MKVLGFGPPGLVADVLPDVLGRAGHELVEVGPNIADQLMQVDALVLWIPPVCVDWGMLDEMHSMLAILRFGKLGQSVKHVVLISSVTSPPPLVAKVGSHLHRRAAQVGGSEHAAGGRRSRELGGWRAQVGDDRSI